MAPLPGTILVDRYRIERELGQGGMATVYLAHDLRHDRQVALKVLRPELAAVLGPERFLNEVRITAGLDHPHIVTLIDSGTSDGLLWYVLPYIRGESLRTRLLRERQLGVADALAITRQIASALAFAHQRGVIHRDVKPENILLHEGEAMLADFGIALAVKEAGGNRLTETGISLGTPQYMSPEQASGERQLDARSDVYSLAAVFYEMLAGEPPHNGPTAQAVVAKLMTERPTPLRVVRATVPEGIDAAVARALAKVPADRFPSAGEFAEALEGGGRTGGETVAAVGARWWPVAAAALVAILALIGYAVWPRGQATGVDPNLVAVLPFRIAGAEPSLHYLREGMIDLLAAKLTGEGGGLRAADPRTATSAWRRTAGSSGDQDLPQAAALGVARGLGAGRLVVGGIVGSPAHLVLSATLLTVPSGRTATQASVEGPADSLPALLDRLISEMLVRSSGLSTTRQASLTTTSVGALQAYLAGQVDYRRGRYSAAAQAFGRALEQDSSFSLAAFALSETYGWLIGQLPPGEPAHIYQTTWAGRDRLSARDRALLHAFLGPDYPDPSSHAERLSARERAVEVAPDSPDAWYYLGDEYYHWGRYLGYDDWMDRATRAFESAIALDSSFVGPATHLIQLAAAREDTAAARRYRGLYLADSAARGEGLDLVVSWDLARTLRDPALVHTFWAAYESSPFTLGPAYLAWTGADTTIVDSALHVEEHRATNLLQSGIRQFMQGLVLLERGRPRAAALVYDSLMRRVRIGDAEFWQGSLPILVLQGLYHNADSGLSASAARDLARFVDGPLSRDTDTRRWQYYGACVLGQWEVGRGHLTAAAREISRLHTATRPGEVAMIAKPASTCVALLEAMAATTARRADARRLVEQADSIIARGPVAWGPLQGPPLLPFENLALARMFAVLGDSRRALGVLRRGGPDRDEGVLLFAPYLREEGRLAALAGDRDGAIRAYQRYLALRPHPEPSIKPEVETVRAELAALVAER